MPFKHIIHILAIAMALVGVPNAVEAQGATTQEVLNIQIPKFEDCSGMFFKCSRKDELHERATAGTKITLQPEEYLRFVADPAMNDDSAILLAETPGIKELAFTEGCRLTSAGWENVAKCVGVDTIEICKIGELADVAIEHIAAMPALKALTIKGCHDIRTGKGFTGDTLHHCRDAKQLESISIVSCCYLKQSSLTHLKAIPALTEVSLTQDFDDTVFKYLGQIPNLKRLRVASQFLTGEFLADCSWPLLASLQLTNSRKTLSANLWNSLASMPELAELELCTVKPLTGLDKDCTAKLKGLSFLVLNRCKFITSTEIEMLAKLPALNKIELNRCNDVSTIDLIPLKDSATLSKLIIIECALVSADVISLLQGESFDGDEPNDGSLKVEWYAPTGEKAR